MQVLERMNDNKNTFGCWKRKINQTFLFSFLNIKYNEPFLVFLWEGHGEISSLNCTLKYFLTQNPILKSSETNFWILDSRIQKQILLFNSVNEEPSFSFCLSAFLGSQTILPNDPYLKQDCCYICLGRKLMEMESSWIPSVSSAGPKTSCKIPTLIFRRKRTWFCGLWKQSSMTKQNKPHILIYNVIAGVTRQEPGRNQFKDTR